MTKGKSHCRGARCDILKSNERNARRKARAKEYDRTRYDGHDKPEAQA
jgi:hypothetical protein